MEAHEAERGTGTLGALRLHYLAAFVAFGAYLPYFPRWLEARGARGAAMSAIAALLPAMGIVSPPLFGLVADALGLRASLLRVACLGAALPFVAIAVLGGAEHRELGFATLFGLVLAFAFFRAPMTMMADVVAIDRAREHGDAYGKTRLFGSVGFLAAAIVVGRVVDVEAASALPVVLAAAFGAAFLAALALPSRVAPPERPSTLTRAHPFAGARDLARQPGFALFLGVVFVAQVAHASYDLCASLHLRDLGASGGFTGAYWAAGVVAEVALMYFAERVFARASARRLLAVGVAGSALRWLAMALVTSRVALFALQPLHALSFGLVWLASLAYLKDEASPLVASTAQGFFSAVLALGSVVGMFAWGPLYASSGGRAVYGAAALVAAAAALMAARFARHRRLPSVSQGLP